MDGIGWSRHCNFYRSRFRPGALVNITAPVAGIRIPDEMWVDKGTDAEITEYKDGAEGQEVGDFVTDIFTANPVATNILAIQATVNAEAQAGELELWDNTSYNTTTKESLAGTTNHVESFWIAVETSSNVAVGAGVGSIPAAYLTQTANTVTYKLEGSTRKITFTTALGVDNQNRWIMHMSIPDDATNPSEANRTVELTYHYYYT